MFCVHESYSVSSITSGTGASCDCALGLDACEFAIAIRFLSNNSQSVCQSLLASRRLLPHPPDVDLGLRLVCGKDATGLGLGPASPPKFKNRGPTRQSTWTPQNSLLRGPSRSARHGARKSSLHCTLHGTDQPPPPPTPPPLAAGTRTHPVSTLCCVPTPTATVVAASKNLNLSPTGSRKPDGLTASPPFPSCSSPRVLLYTRGRALDPYLLPRLTPSSSVPSHPLTRIPLGYSPLPFKNAPLRTEGYHPPINPSSIAR